MLLLGIDIGTSSIKVSVVDAATQRSLATVQYPETETPISSPKPGWAEQSPETWWQHVQKAILKANGSGKYDPVDIGAIGIAYQMHGLVITDSEFNVLRPSIIWCDSRAVAIGAAANQALGPAYCLEHLLNSPGNFTASKLAWVKENEPDTYAQVAHVMLPGDYIAFRLCGNVTTTPSALSEGVFWDFTTHSISTALMRYYGFADSFIPSLQDVFSEHGQLDAKVAAPLSLRAGIPVSYKAGDQPNNALSLGVTEPGEVAATAGTSGVIYAVSDQLTYDPLSRVNSFAHVNHTRQQTRTGVLLCINGTGILNSWARQQLGSGLSYAAMNELAANTEAGSGGVRVLPFGNGSERMLENKVTGVHFSGIDLNQHKQAHLFRAIQEGIAFAFRYGIDIMRSNKVFPTSIRAGKANLFQSDVFLHSFVAATGVPVTLYASDGSVGAALGAGIGCGYYKQVKDAFSRQQAIRTVHPDDCDNLEAAYQEWLQLLQKQIL
ncbi:xylulokinase [Flavihumibacter profundi]|uniref:xylulokinase n=1 Tax=Flavihumibacter profundi TaxID=2716883 RepID=UPI001CC62CA2|nr:FGGY family carbohydrate kinase [Flavihumibacter profundi]MBZ5858444.1 carbohydrate kinase [Flavihumibacter profundi]